MKTVLITGASRGIGRFLFNNLIAKGYSVVGLSKNPPKELEDKIYKCNLLNLNEVEKIFNLIKEKYETLYGIINCAGVLNSGLLLSVSNEKIDEMVNINFKGTVICCKYAIKLMLKNNIGRVINFSSIASKLAISGDGIYSATKSAINTFTEALAKEIEKKKITVNAIAPGLVITDMTASMTYEKKKSLTDLQIIQKDIPLESILNTVDFLLSEKSNFISGQTIQLG